MGGSPMGAEGALPAAGAMQLAAAGRREPAAAGLHLGFTWAWDCSAMGFMRPGLAGLCLACNLQAELHMTQEMIGRPLPAERVLPAQL